jgi:hypothetical protein
LTEECRVREREGGKEGVKERKREDRKVGSSSRTGSDHFIQHLWMSVELKEEPCSV